MPDITGEVLANRYHVQEFVGRGGMAEVYKVWDQEMAVHLAMKLLHDDLADDRVFVRRFKREADTLSKLQHPHIVRMYGIKESGLHVFMLMDFIEGKSLKREIRLGGRDGLASARVREVMKAICSALHFAHNQGFIHADIKPTNLIVDGSNKVFLADFGIARMTDAATATMVGAGTPAYMSPEQCRGLDPTPQSDIYSLGIVLYEMLTGGERPFTGEATTTTGSTGEKVRWEQVNLNPPRPSQFNSALNPKVEEVVMKCLSKDPKDRYANALDLYNALEVALGGEQPMAAPDMEDISPTEILVDPIISKDVVVEPATPKNSDNIPQFWNCKNCGRPVAVDFNQCPYCQGNPAVVVGEQGVKGKHELRKAAPVWIIAILAGILLEALFAASEVTFEMLLDFMDEEFAFITTYALFGIGFGLVLGIGLRFCRPDAKINLPQVISGFVLTGMLQSAVILFGSYEFELEILVPLVLVAGAIGTAVAFNGIKELKSKNTFWPVLLGSMAFSVFPLIFMYTY